MTPHSSTLAWKIPWMEESGRENFQKLSEKNPQNHINYVLTKVYMETLKKIHSHLNILHKN